MPNLFDPEELMSPEVLKRAIWLLTMLLLATAAYMVLHALGNILFGFRIRAAIVQLVSGIGGPLAIWLIVRLLAEQALNQGRLADRLTDLTSRPDDTESTTPVAEVVSATPAPTVETVEVAQAAKPEKTTAEPKTAENAEPSEDAKPKRRRRRKTTETPSEDDA